MSDEAEADDGAIYKFWEFIAARLRRRDPEFDLEDVAQLLEAIHEYEAQP